MILRKLLGTAALAVGLATGVASADTIKIGSIAELSGAGAAAGTNWRDGLVMAFDEINEAGGILGEQIEVMQYDSQTDPQTSRALVQKAIDDGAYVLMGTVYSGSTIVNMLVAQQNGYPQLTGSEAPRITQLNNPYIFRTTFGAQKGVPKVATYMKEDMGVTKAAIAWVNSEFGKGGHETFVAEMEKHGIKIVADVASEQGQADFAADVLKLKRSGAEAAFVYLTEEESARFLREARKQNLEIPLIGETTLIGNKVIELAGEAANGAMGHVALSPEIPVEGVKQMVERFQERFNYVPDHNAIKGYTGAYTIKYVTEMIGEADRQKFADKMHGLTLKAAEYPGILIDISWDDTGEVSRESYLAEVVDGKQKIIKTLPAN